MDGRGDFATFDIASKRGNIYYFCNKYDLFKIINIKYDL